MAGPRQPGRLRGPGRGAQGPGPVGRVRGLLGAPARAGRAQLRLGSNDGIIVWVNGKVVSDRKVSRAAEPDQDRADCDLTAGWNEVRVKVDNTGGRWGFYLELRDASPDKPLGPLEFRKTPPSPAPKK